jgi:hypothetical protein
LIDDDPDNVMIALNNQVRAVHCDPKNPALLARDLLALQ